MSDASMYRRPIAARDLLAKGMAGGAHRRPEDGA
jgi:hypothetical protein